MEFNDCYKQIDDFIYDIVWIFNNKSLEKIDYHTFRSKTNKFLPGDSINEGREFTFISNSSRK